MKQARKLFLMMAFWAAFWGVGCHWAAPARGEEARAKYVFLFIGDGMGLAQRRAAELYLAAQSSPGLPEDRRLVMNTLPAQGLADPGDLTSVIPDSASAATAIACGRKTRSGVLAMDADGETPCETIAETARKNRWKVGILSTVSLDHATPAAFHAHVPSRGQLQEISLQLANSGFDYFAGGRLSITLAREGGPSPDAVEMARARGYKVVTGRDELQALKPGSGKVIAMSRDVDESGAMPFSLDRQGDPSRLTIADLLVKAVELLDNPRGFFIMVEGGKIDWACHAHDAAAAIHDILALDHAVARAVDFHGKRPLETLVVVTADHETGGMSIGFAGTKHSIFIEKLRHQKMSAQEFERRLAEYRRARPAGDPRLEEVLPLIHEGFGLHVLTAEEKARLEAATTEVGATNVLDDPERSAAEARVKLGMALTDSEIDTLRKAWSQSVAREKGSPGGDHARVRHEARRDPLAIALTTIMSNKAGLGWTTFDHTGIPVPASALGVGAELFNGYYGLAEIHGKIMKSTGLER
jgi:alkaline phosphatase